jgi:hypothetical protein
MQPLRDAVATARAFPAFVALVLLTLATAGFNALMVGLMALRLDELLPGAFAEMGHFTELHHRVHDVTFAALFIPPVLGLLAQLRRPDGNVAGMLMAWIPSAALLIVAVVTFVQGGDLRVVQPPWLMVMAGTLLATALHPAGSGFFRSFRRARISWGMLAFVGVAAVPLLWFAYSNIGLQASVTDDHAAAGHYGFMAAFSLATLGVAALASVRPDGWRLAAWCAGVLPTVVAAASLASPEAASSIDLPWAVTAVAGAAMFVVVAELRARGQRHPATARADAGP